MSSLSLHELQGTDPGSASGQTLVAKHVVGSRLGRASQANNCLKGLSMRGVVLSLFRDISRAGSMITVLSMNTDETTDGHSRKCSLQNGVAQWKVHSELVALANMQTPIALMQPPALRAALRNLQVVVPLGRESKRVRAAAIRESSAAVFTSGCVDTRVGHAIAKQRTCSTSVPP